MIDEQSPYTDATHAAVELVGRTGARHLEVGYLNDTLRSEDADWWAAATYQGARIIVEHHRSPTAALEALAHRLLAGGECRHCGGVVRLDSPGAARAHGARPVCRWRRVGRHWERGCSG